MFGKTPREISDSYSHLASLHESGQPVLAILEFFERDERSREGPRPSRLVRRLKKGASLHAAMREEGLPALDVELIRVAEHSGKMAEAALLLANYYEDRHKLRRSLRKALTKPFLLIAATLLLGSLPDVVGDRISPMSYALHTFGVLALIGGGIWAAFGWSRRNGALSFRFVRAIPWFGKFSESLAMERFFTCFALCHRSGCDFQTTAELLERVARHPKLQAAASLIRRESSRLGLAESFAASHAFRSDQVQAIRVGEKAGKLDETFRKICATLREQINDSIAAFEDWAPKIAYGMAMAYAAYNIFVIYGQVFGQAMQFG